MRKTYTILAGLILLYLIHCVINIQNTAITFDEGSHLSYGIRLLKGEPQRTNPEKDNSKMPISVLNALPRAFEQFTNNELVKSDNGRSDTIKGRYLTLAFSVLIILLVFKWSSTLYGNHAGLFAAFLYACCPNSLSNAILVTTDTYASFFLLATLYSCWKFLQQRTLKNYLLFCIVLAASQLAKQSLFHLYVLLPLCFIGYGLLVKEKWAWGSILKKTLIAISISWLIINAGFIFFQVFLPLGEYSFMSSFFKGIQELFPAGFPVPVSSAFLEGLDQAKYYDQLGGGLANSSFGNVTILGHSGTGKSFWYYYFVTLVFKTPLTYLLLLGWSTWLLIKKRNFVSFIRNEFFLIAPILYFLLLMSFFYNTQAGIRHLIFIYPLIFVLCGSLVKFAATKMQRGILVVLSLFLMISVAPYHKNYFAYTNELVWNKTRAYKLVGASNLNFGQANDRVKQWLVKNPDWQPAPETARPGKFVLVVDRYLDIWNTGKYSWLKEVEPVGHLEYVYLKFIVQ